MLDEIRNRIRAVPFLPFIVRVADGRSFRVPHSDHILVTSKGLVVIENDEGLLDILPSLMISGISTQAAA